MYKFKAQILKIGGPKHAFQKSYGFKKLVRFWGGQTIFKNKVGTGTFKKTCSTSNHAGVGSLFDKFNGFFCSDWRAWQLGSLSSQTKPSVIKPSRAKWNQSGKVSHDKRRKEKQANLSNVKQSKSSKESRAMQTNAKQATKPTKTNQSKTSKQTKEKQKSSQLKAYQSK